MPLKVRLVLAFALSIILVGGRSWYAIRAQSPDQPEYFRKYGHRLTGEFYLKYYSVPDPKLLYGEPTTIAFTDPKTGRYIQYFEKVRFELHNELPASQRVQISPLGKYIYVPGNPTAQTDSSASCRTFAENGYQVCYAFLHFYENNNGLESFGLPISNAENHNGRIVQYFERARLEWQPEFPAGERVQLGNLGLEYFDLVHEDPSVQKPEYSIIEGSIDLQVRAFPGLAVTGPTGKQTVYIVVQDQKLAPVPNAQVTLTVRMPSGEQQNYIVPTMTNHDGVTVFSFDFEAYALGIATIQVEARQANLNLSAQTVTSYRIWR
ncbi:MAG: hypothetical protein JXB15_16960 [Anaerolineales bacterium]|nr:hypothetical protein [Anaerolineales bacterium]